MPAASLEISGLSAGYGPTRVLEDISLAADAGRRLAVLGRNGMGKSTLFATLAGQTKRYGGAIRLGGEAIEGIGSSARALKGLGYVPQSRDVFPTLTVEENLFVGLKGRPRGAIEEAYAMFPRLKERRRNLGSQLSGGEQQMLTTARTILGQPSVLLLDEPLEGLAPIIVEELTAAVGRMASAEGMALVLVEQHAQVALGLTREAVIIERGRIAHRAPSSALIADSATLDRYLGLDLG